MSAINIPNPAANFLPIVNRALVVVMFTAGEPAELRHSPIQIESYRAPSENVEPAVHTTVQGRQKIGRQLSAQLIFAPFS